MIRAILLKTIPVAVFALGFGYLQTATSAPQPTSERALIDQYCVGCHNQRLKTADLMLDKADPANPAADPELWARGASPNAQLIKIIPP
jgi:hypothetical protein